MICQIPTLLDCQISVVQILNPVGEFENPYHVPYLPLVSGFSNQA